VRLLGTSLTILIVGFAAGGVARLVLPRWQAARRDEQIEFVVVKAVAGFLNGNGGTVPIGVDDTGEVLGLDRDDQLVRQRPLRALAQRLDGDVPGPSQRGAGGDVVRDGGRQRCVPTRRPAGSGAGVREHPKRSENGRFLCADRQLDAPAAHR
jgi:hypothetical protein